jgi:hypothetical protein
MTSPVPMNRPQRRAAGVKVGPETVPLQLKVYTRRETQLEDGTLLATTYLQPIMANGQALFETIGEDSVPVLIKCEPVVIGRALIVTGPKLVTGR